MIETKRLLIREFMLEDALDLSKYRNKEEVAHYQSWKHYPYIKAKRRIEYCLKYPFNGTKGNYQLAVILKEENKLIGDYFIEVYDERSVALGYTFDSEYWSHGYANETFRAMLSYLKEEYQFKSVFCYVYIDNQRSIRLLENNGFQEYERSVFLGDIGYRKIL